ncbi:MAG: DUF177 domain-containing protein [Pseudomonadota bacterium]
MSEFSRVVPRDRLGAGRLETEYVATPAEAQAIAERAGLLALRDFAVTVTIAPRRGGKIYRLEADLQADVVQTCVVTLEPVTNHVRERLSQDLSLTAPNDASGRGSRSDAVMMDPDALEAPEFFGQDGFDVGEWAVQNLILALDPYPRCSKAPETEDGHLAMHFLDQASASDRDDAESLKMRKDNPFAALEVLKDRMQ